MPAQELGALVQWEKSRLSHQVRRMQEQGLIVREPNPADGRSAMICLLPAGRRAIEAAAPQHVHNVRRHFIDLFTPAELDTFAALNERVLHHLAEESSRGTSSRRARAPALSGLTGPHSRNRAAVT
jgi:DNA-binding MarR family transcriptional regulator